MIPFPDKKYPIIYADPCWDLFKGDGFIGAGGSVNASYPTLPTLEICKIPVQSIANDDCLLFMWIVSSMLEDGLQVGKAWGFKFSTIGFVWEKKQWIIGAYNMLSTEHCLIFRRGKIPQPRGERNVHQFLSCKRGRHSEKSLEIKHRIDKMFPTQSKIELFARPLPLLATQDDGWDYWGNDENIRSVP